MSEEPSTLVSERLRWFQNHRVFSVFIVLALVVIAAGSLTDALDKIRKFVQPESAPTITPSAQVITYTSPVPTTAPTQFAAPVTFKAPQQPSRTQSETERIVAEVSAARPLQKRKVALTYVGIPVDWKLYFSSGDAYPRLTTLNFDTAIDHSQSVTVYAEVFTKGHEDLAMLDVGTPMRVRGKIEYIDGRYIRLKDAQVERCPNP